MGSIRQNRIEGVVQEELAGILQRHTRDICLGAMVSVTVVRITSDLSLARCYLSVFAGPPRICHGSARLAQHDAQSKQAAP